LQALRLHLIPNPFRASYLCFAHGGGCVSNEDLSKSPV
jgi:hypothetical protein